MIETKFFSLPNLSTDSVEILAEPWKVTVAPEVLALPTVQYKARWKNPGTRHWLLSLAQGQNPDFCVSVGNQAAVLYGFAADYDGVLTEDMIGELKKKPQGRYAPAWWCKSHSGKLHLFWFFERPIAVTGNRHANELLKIVARKIKAVRWGVGYDVSCEQVTQVIDIGHDWQVFRENAFIPSEEVVLWDMAIFEKSAREVCEEVVDIPFDVVAEEIRRRTWPQKLPGDIRIGTRCVRFWDPSADNVSGAQIVKDGIRVYTPHDNGFKSWVSLLGSEFCEQYTAKSMAPFFEDTTYCQAKDEYWRFFRNDNPPHYEKRTEKVLRRDLIKEARLATKPPKGEELSELDNALYAITRRNSVDAVAPVLYRPAGRIFVNGLGNVLNTSLVTVKRPAPRLSVVTPEDIAAVPDCPAEYREDPSVCKWDNPFAVRGFPHLHHLLTAFFMTRQASYDAWESNGFPLHDANGTPKPWLADRQLQFLLSWLSHFYVNAARMSQNPGRGQALIMAGPTGVGKSFFATEILGQLMGGWTYAHKFYLDGERFNSTIVQHPVHVIDDKLGSRSQRERLKFTEALKVTVANAKMRCEAKFGSAVEAIPWPGRIVILSNVDAQSLSVLPDLDMSTRDKFMMLKLGGAKGLWGSSDAERQKTLAEEIPFLARFLLGWRIPADLADERFGVRAVQHADMAQASAENGLTQVLLEVLETCIESVTGTRDDADRSDADGCAIEGNAVKIFKWIKSVDDSLTREVIDSRTLQQNLQILWKNGAYNIGYDEELRRWKIPYVLRKKSENHR